MVDYYICNTNVESYLKDNKIRYIRAWAIYGEEGKDEMLAIYSDCLDNNKEFLSFLIMKSDTFKKLTKGELITQFLLF